MHTVRISMLSVIFPVSEAIIRLSVEKNYDVREDKFSVEGVCLAEKNEAVKSNLERDAT